MAEFIDELPELRGGRHYQIDAELTAFANELRANPGRWAQWPRGIKNPYAAANNIKRGLYASLSSGFEAAVRNKALYVRYVGEQASG